MRYILPVLSVLALGACTPPEVDSRNGVGFQDYTLYQQQAAYLNRSRAVAPTAPVVAAAPALAPSNAPAAPVIATALAPASAPAPVTASAGATDSIGADTLAAIGAPLSAVNTSAPAPAPMTVMATAPAAAAAPAPAAAAPVTGFGTNIAAFALATTHPVGQQMYRRSSALRTNNDRACARYPADTMAQEAFLEAGGPERDRLNLDPDGDGYACRWDPAPFRLARS